MVEYKRKILVINPFGTGKYDELIRKVIGKVKMSDTQIDVCHLKRGFSYIDYWTYYHLIASDVVDRIYNAEKEGYNGVFVACGYEVGVRAAREIVNIPVVGALIPTVLIATQLGAKLSIFYDAKIPTKNSWDLLKLYNLDNNCALIDSLDLSLGEIVKNPEIVDKRIIERSTLLLEKGIEVVILACTIVAANFTGNVPSSLSKMVFLNSNTCSFKYLEMLVDLFQKFGVKVSRLGYYSSPIEKNRMEFEQARIDYGYEKS